MAKWLTKQHAIVHVHLWNKAPTDTTAANGSGVGTGQNSHLCTHAYSALVMKSQSTGVHMRTASLIDSYL